MASLGKIYPYFIIVSGTYMHHSTVFLKW